MSDDEGTPTAPARPLTTTAALVVRVETVLDPRLLPGRDHVRRVPLGGSAMRGTMMVARCLCGSPVIGSHEQPHPNRFWCGECVSFVEAAIRGSDAFHGYLPDEGMDVVGFMSRLEARLIESALERAGTTAGAARLLGLNRTTLVEKLKRARRSGEAR